MKKIAVTLILLAVNLAALAAVAQVSPIAAILAGA